MTIQLTDSEILSRVTGVVCEVLNVSPDQVSPATAFVDDLRAESLEINTMLMEFDEAFDSTIPDDDASRFITVGDTVNYIKANCAPAP